jgi:GNAT superfamily N-acetyltransferase
MGTTIREASNDEHEELIPVLLLAEPSERALRWSLENLSDSAYRLDVDGELVAAATMRWDEPCELVELGVREDRQGHGLGRLLVEWLLAEGRRRKKKRVYVGTSSTSAGNILFYQKCGFRVDSVRHDYFWYYSGGRYENGLRVRDMIVFRHELR